MAYYEGDIFNYIHNQDTRGLALFDIKLMTYQIFRGLMFVHALNIAHRDIKPHNLLF